VGCDMAGELVLGLFERGDVDGEADRALAGRRRCLGDFEQAARALDDRMASSGAGLAACPCLAGKRCRRVGCVDGASSTPFATACAVVVSTHSV